MKAQRDQRNDYYRSRKTIHSGQTDDLKMKDDKTKVWVSRVENGKDNKPMVTIEHNIGDKWITQYHS